MQGNRRTKGMAELDGLRLAHGNGQLAHIFRGFCERDRANAARLLNDGRLRFPSLFLLRPEIVKQGLEGALSESRCMALELTGALASAAPGTAWKGAPEHLGALRWMLRTGADAEGLGGQYDAVMDRVAALLAREHGDRECLPALANMVFARRRKGLYAGDAEWALFESGDPACLGLIAARLSSRNGSDVEHARRLLGFIPCLGEGAASTERQRRLVSRWIALNRPRLRYTGLGSQMGPNPARFEVSETDAPPAPESRSTARKRKGKGAAT